MRKFYALTAALILTLAIGVTAMAHGQKRGNLGNNHDCGNCDMADQSSEQLRTFKLETLDLRREIMNRRLDLQREKLQETPDSGKIAALEADITAIKEKIEAKRKEANLPEHFCNDRDCFKGRGDCSDCGKQRGCANRSCDMKCGDCSNCKDCKECCKGKECKGCDCSGCDSKAGCPDCKKVKGKTKKKAPVKPGCSKCNLK